LGLIDNSVQRAALTGWLGQAADLKLRFLSSSEIKASKLVLMLAMLDDFPPTALRDRSIEAHLLQEL